MPRLVRRAKSIGFSKGKELQGFFAIYVVTSERLGRGQWGKVYKARVKRLLSRVTEVPEEIRTGRTVVIKTPSAGPGKEGLDESARALGILNLWKEYSSHDRLERLPCAARVVDAGLDRIVLSTGPTLSTFVVQRYVRGVSLRDYMREDKSKGISDVRTFLGWARSITCALLQVHRRQVVHADIWPGNIMVETGTKRSARPVLIDFGLAKFKELTTGRVGETLARSEFRAPEGSGTVAADIYALGGVLYYLASGRKPPKKLRNLRGIDDIKNHVTRNINPRLLRENCGIADVIARCLRRDPSDRNPHAESVLRDIETFMSNVPGTGLAQAPCKGCPIHPAPTIEDVRRLSDAIADLKARNLLFYKMSRVRARHLLLDVDDMLKNVYDLVGDHEEIVSAMTEYLSILQKGDKYLTISAPSFWRPRNLGINGRFLSMNQLVAERGACVQRVFLVTWGELMRSQEVHSIMKAHLRVMRAVQTKTGRDPSGEVGAAGYYAAFKVVTKKERNDLWRQDFHFGLLQKKRGSILLVPVYRGDGVITAIQFRAAPNVRIKVAKFSELLKGGRPLWEFDVRCQPE